jgi:hypothetical protein
MKKLIAILLIGIISLVGYLFPKKYNEYFRRKYHENIVSMPLATTTAVFCVTFLLVMDNEGFWFWTLLIAAIVLLIASIIYAICIGTQTRANAFETAIGALAQICAIVGIVIIIILILTLIFGNKKKKKR